MLMKDTIKGSQAFIPGNILINPVIQLRWVEDHPGCIPSPALQQQMLRNGREGSSCPAAATLGKLVPNIHI